MPDPTVTIDLARIEHNARAVVSRCAESGIRVFGVTKGTCGMPQVARAMLRGGVVGLAESRFENIRRLRDSGIDAPIMLLRTPPHSRIEEMVRHVEISLQSELAVIREIARIAERLGRVHDIVLMIDLGDLREGIWPNDLVETVERVVALPGVRIAGVGTNLTCFGAIMPTEENLGQLVAHAYKVERVTGRQLDWVSGGNSSSLPLLLDGRMPAGVNNLRIGEAILQGGIDTFVDKPWTALDRDAFRLTGELLEVKVKPSLPIGISGVDAFGQRPIFVDEGDRLRGIANIGREDVIVEGLVPTHPGVRVLGASSDHLMLDLTEAAPPLEVGDDVSFRVNYGAMLAAMTSEYVEKVPMRDVEDAPARRTVSIFADADAATALAGQNIEARLAAAGRQPHLGQAGADGGALAAALDRREPVLFAGPDRLTALAAGAVAKAYDAIGLIWLDAAAAMMPAGAGERPDESAVLGHMLATLPPQISPENVVLIGLRHADPAESAALKASRASVYTMVEVDAMGLRDVMREALKIASAGVRGFHLAYSPDATDLPGWRGGGGLTVRETHQAMEAVARHGGMVSMSVAGIGAATDPQVVAECSHFIASAFGKQIL